MSEIIKLVKPNVGQEAFELLKEVIESGMLVEGKMVHEFENTVKEKIRRLSVGRVCCRRAIRCSWRRGWGKTG